jgi:hypothetical protein
MTAKQQVGNPPRIHPHVALSPVPESVILAMVNYAVAGAVALAAAYAALIATEWAPAINTALIILLAAYNAHTSRKAANADRAARDAKRAIGADKRNHQVPDTGQRRRFTDHH